MSPSVSRFARAGAGLWVALIVARRGVGLELVAGAKREALAAIRGRWPTLPIDRLACAVQTGSANGHRVNPAAIPRRVELTNIGRGEYSAFILDAGGRELERFQASLDEAQARLGGRYPGLPVRFLPLRNPAGR